jgi:hypothetical protein
MKILLSITTFLLLLSTSLAFCDVKLESDSNDTSHQKYYFEITDGGRKAKKTVYLVGAENTVPSRIVYIFHGYKPVGDFYQQSPTYFIINWNLSKLSKKYGILFVLPDNGTSVYPITKLNDPLSDMSMLNTLKKEMEIRYKVAKSPLAVGFSAGVEGAVKFAILNNIQEIMAISGNYDLNSIPVNEKAFHEKDFGPGKDIFDKENPIALLKNTSKTIYLFCEEKNPVNVAQAQILVNASLAGIELIDLRNIGKGYSHDWKFLTSPGIIKNLEKIISGDINDLITK